MKNLVAENLKEAILAGGKRIEDSPEEKMRGTGNISQSKAFSPYEQDEFEKSKIAGRKKAGKFGELLKAYTDPSKSRSEEILKSRGIDINDRSEEEINQEIWDQLSDIYKKIKSAVYNSKNPSDAAIFAENEMSKILNKIEYRDLDKNIFKEMDYEEEDEE